MLHRSACLSWAMENHPLVCLVKVGIVNADPLLFTGLPNHYNISELIRIPGLLDKSSSEELVNFVNDFLPLRYKASLFLLNRFVLGVDIQFVGHTSGGILSMSDADQAKISKLAYKKSSSRFLSFLGKRTLT